MTPFVLAHGIGGRSDLPLPLWLFTYGASVALVASFVALRLLWPRARLEAAAEGRPLSAGVQRVAAALFVPARAVGLALLVIVFVAAAWGTELASSNLAPIAVYVVFWVGMQVVSALVGDVWWALNPIDTLARPLVRARPNRVAPPWTAGAMLLSFVWLELAYHDPSAPRAIAVWLGLYVVAALAGAAWWGRDWARRGEGFAALFGLLAHLAPFFRDDRGQLRIRPPLSGLADVATSTSTGVVVLVVLGSTTFDGLTRTRFWSDVVVNRSGWELTAYNTVGLVWTIALVTAVYLLATRLAAAIGQRDARSTALAFLPSLVPILLAYSLAHYFSLLVFEGQRVWSLASDPLGRGWDLFGTTGRAVNYTWVSTDTIAYVQAGAIVVGHVAGVIAAHDRAVSLWPPRLAERTQYPMLGVMVLYTVGGLAILLGS